MLQFHSCHSIALLTTTRNSSRCLNLHARLRGPSNGTREGVARASLAGNLAKRRKLSLDTNTASRYTATPAPRRSYAKAIFIAGAVMGVLYLSYRYVHSQIIPKWPPEVQDNARAALWSERKGEKEKALRYWEAALSAVRSAPLATLGPHPYLLISGIGTLLADRYLEAGQTDNAIKLLADLADPDKESSLRVASEKHTAHEVVRQICVLAKLAEVLEDQAATLLTSSMSRSASRDEILALARRIDKTYDTALLLAARFRLEAASSTVVISFPPPPTNRMRELLGLVDMEELKVDASALFMSAARSWSGWGEVFADKALAAYNVAGQTLLYLSEQQLSGGKLEQSVKKRCLAMQTYAESAELMMRVWKEHLPPPQQGAKSAPYTAREDREQLSPRQIAAMDAYDQAQKWAGEVLAETLLPVLDPEDRLSDTFNASNSIPKPPENQRVRKLKESCPECRFAGIAGIMCLATYHERMGNQSAAEAWWRALERAIGIYRNERAEKGKASRKEDTEEVEEGMWKIAMKEAEMGLRRLGDASGKDDRSDKPVDL